MTFPRVKWSARQKREETSPHSHSSHFKLSSYTRKAAYSNICLLAFAPLLHPDIGRCRKSGDPKRVLINRFRLDSDRSIQLEPICWNPEVTGGETNLPPSSAEPFRGPSLCLFFPGPFLGSPLRGRGQTWLSATMFLFFTCAPRQKSRMHTAKEAPPPIDQPACESRLVPMAK